MNIKLTKDIVERAFWTAVQSFIATYTIGGIDQLKAAGISALAAGLSVLKGFVATKIGDPNSAATLK